LLPTQLGHKRSDLKIVTRLASEHIPNAIICVGTSRSYPFRFITHYALLILCIQRGRSGKRLHVHLRSYRDDFAPTESLRLQEMIPTHRHSDLKIVTHLASENMPNAIICVGASHSYPFRFITHYALLILCIQSMCIKMHAALR